MAVKTAEKRIKSAEKAPETAKVAENDLFLLSISALSRKFKLDRATVRERLDAAEIKPKTTREKEKLYHLDDVEIVLSQSELNEAKLRKLDAEAELKELEVKKKLGEYASVAEFTETVQKIFGRLHKRVVVQLPKRIAGRLHNANSSAEVMAALETELAKEFNDLRSDFTKFL